MLLFIWLTFFTSVITSVKLRFHIADSAVNTQGRVSGASAARSWCCELKRAPPFFSFFALQPRDPCLSATTRWCRAHRALLDRHSSQGRPLSRTRTWIWTLLRDSRDFRSPVIIQPLVLLFNLVIGQYFLKLIVFFYFYVNALWPISVILFFFL